MDTWSLYILISEKNINQLQSALWIMWAAVCLFEYISKVYSGFFPADQVLNWFILPPLCHLITSRLRPLTAVTPSITPAGGHNVLPDSTCQVSSRQRRGSIKQSNQSINQSIFICITSIHNQSHLMTLSKFSRSGPLLRFVSTCPGFWPDWKALV